MPTIQIDNRAVDVEAGGTVLDGARKLGIEIPTLCHRDGCTPNTSCLACVVRVNGGSRLVPSCATKAVEGMVVESETDEVRLARKTALELLLADHAGDCRAPCQNVCPAHMDIPTMIRQISAGQFREALITVKDRIALPAVLGRICPELCEKGCRRASIDESVSICRLKRFVADVDLASGNPYRPEPEPPSGKSVAIIGAGPTGLAAAYYLAQLGHGCVVFDNNAQPGGNLRYAVGKDKLPWEVLDAEIAQVTRLGVEIRCGQCAGADLRIAAIREEFDAVLIAAGEMNAAKAAALDLEMSGKGVKVDRRSMMTPAEGVFAAGAAVTPFRHAVRAVGEGRNASVAIDLYLRGQEPRAPEPAFTVRLGVLNQVEVATFTAGASRALRAAGDVSRALPQTEAQQEAGRCLECACGKLHGCELRRWSSRYDASPATFKMPRKAFERVETHPLVTYEPGKCIACGLCVQIAERAREPLGLSFVGRGFAVKVAAPLGGAMSDALTQVAGECARACPTGALVLKGQR
jgi:ferredoxin